MSSPMKTGDRVYNISTGVCGWFLEAINVGTGYLIREEGDKYPQVWREEDTELESLNP